jgi:hypothetical protein
MVVGKTTFVFLLDKENKLFQNIVTSKVVLGGERIPRPAE